MVSHEKEAGNLCWDWKRSKHHFDGYSLPVTTSPPQPSSPSAGAGAKYQQEATLYCWITTFRATACKSILSWKMEKETSSLLILVKTVKRYLSCLICFLGAIEWGMIDTYKDNAPYPKIDVTKKSFIWAKHRLVCLHY